MKENREMPIQKAHETVRATTEKVAGHTAAKVNLRQALEFSLSKKAYVEDMIPDMIEGFNDYNTHEQMSITEYVLLADLLKRKLWSELNENLKSIMKLPDVDHIKENAPGWKETIDKLQGVIDRKSEQFLVAWAQRMRTSEPDEMCRQRFQELDAVTKKQEEKFRLNRTPEKVLIVGYRTGIAFPMGMLKHMPDLLRDKGIEPTKNNIVEYFIKNLVGTNSTYAAQDLYSFGMIDSVVNATESPLSTPADFSPDFFMLNETGKIVMKKEAFETIHQTISPRIPESLAVDHVEKNRMLNAMEHKPQLPEGKAKYSWKGCPALFANLITDYEHFFKPILEGVLDIETEYK